MRSRGGIVCRLGRGSESGGVGGEGLCSGRCIHRWVYCLLKDFEAYSVTTIEADLHSWDLCVHAISFGALIFQYE